MKMWTRRGAGVCPRSQRWTQWGAGAGVHAQSQSRGGARPCAKPVPDLIQGPGLWWLKMWMWMWKMGGWDLPRGQARARGYALGRGSLGQGQGVYPRLGPGGVR